MREIRDPAELHKLLAEPGWGWAEGALPAPFPPDALLWFAPLSIGEAAKVADDQALVYGAGYEPTDGLRAILAHALRYDPEAPTLSVWRRRAGVPGGEPGEVPDEVPDEGAAADPLDVADLLAPFDPLEPELPAGGPEALRRLWESTEEVEGLGDPTLIGSPANLLLSALLASQGLAEEALAQLDSPTAPTTVDGDSDLVDLRAIAAASRYPGRWVRGLFAADPEAALWVRAASTREIEAAQNASMRAVSKVKDVVNDLKGVPVLLSHVVRQGPGGPPLLDLTLAARLPFGAARALEYVSKALTYPEGGWSFRVGHTGARGRRPAPASDR